MTGGDVICAGRIYCDLVFTGLDGVPRAGVEVFADSISLHAGGGAFISAATFAALGRPSALWGVAPADPFGAVVLSQVEAAGVVATHCEPAPAGSEPQLTVAMVADGDRAFLTRAPGRALPEAALPPGARHLHIGELRTLQEHPDLIGAARARGMSISLDCAWDETRSADVADLIAAVDVFLPNEAEAAQLQHLGLDARMAPLTIVKRGARGSSAITGHGRVDACAPRVEVRDTIGAGDAFNAGFLHRWLAGAEVAECLAFGNACGAATVGGIGGTGGRAAIREMARPPERGAAG